MAPRISIVINTLNEEENLPFALRSVRTWADEIIVVDMYSDDRTVEIAGEYGARVLFHERTEVVDAARGFAIAQATGDWILLLDADEVVPAPLSEQLREIARNGAIDVASIARVNYLLGQPLLHTGWGPEQDRHPRFFRRGAVQVTDVIHDFLRPIADSRVVELPYRPGHALVHFNYLDTTHFLDKLNRYTGVEALQAFQRGERATPARTLLRGAREFVGRFLKNEGYRDGWRGFYLSLFMVFYRIATYAKLRELEDAGSREAIRDTYREEAERLVRDYPDACAPSPRVAPPARRGELPDRCYEPKRS